MMLGEPLYSKNTMHSIAKIQKEIQGLFGRVSWKFEKGINDPRDNRGKRWRLSSVLQSIFLGFVCGSTTYRDVEKLSIRLPKWLKIFIPRRISDTTLRNVISVVDPKELEATLVTQVKEEYRGKRLPIQYMLPIHIVSIDGKVQTGKAPFHPACEKRVMEKTGVVYYHLAFMRAVLTSAHTKVCLQVERITRGTNDMGYFKTFFLNMLKHYPSDSYFEMATLDAGFTSLKNCSLVDLYHKAYCAALKENQPELYREAQRVFNPMFITEAEYTSSWEHQKGKRFRYLFWRTEEMNGYLGWTHLRQVWCVRKETKDSHGKIQVEDRFFLTNLPVNRLSAQHASLAIRKHWGVENDCHWTLDTQWMEDDSIISTKGRSFESLLILRMMAYNFDQILKNKVFRKLKHDFMGWKDLFKDAWTALTIPLMEYG
jgi:predicted transposase YbfD/YdcC